MLQNTDHKENKTYKTENTSILKVFHRTERPAALKLFFAT